MIIMNLLNLRLTRLLKRIKSYLSLHTGSRILFYNSYILPNFDYADIVCGDRGNETFMTDLQILQNKAARKPWTWIIDCQPVLL
jgi:hypothetical protein